MSFSLNYFIGHIVGDFLLQPAILSRNKKRDDLAGWLACTLHCVLYTLAVCWCTGWSDLRVAALVFMSHFIFDKTLWAARLGWVLSPFKEILSGKTPHTLWGYLIVDNSLHLVCLWVIDRWVRYADVLR